jgi:glutamyl-tRNA reductase
VFQALYCEEAADGVEHLFRVASGLDSMVLGETEILGQLKEAYELARREGHTGRVLNTVFQGAFRAAKQVRSETGIQRGAVSVASLAVELAEETFGDLAGCRVLVLGAGDTGEKVTRALLDRGVAEVRIVNRSEERGRALAATLGPRALALPDWSGSLDEVDVVVGSTSSPSFVLDEARLGPAVRARKGRPLLLVDLAMPRDFDPAIAGMPGVRLLNIDDLRSLAERHLEQRQVEVLRCEELLRAQVSEVMNRL